MQIENSDGSAVCCVDMSRKVQGQNIVLVDKPDWPVVRNYPLCVSLQGVEVEAHP